MAFLTKTTPELQRNRGEVSALCYEMRQPVYITRNGEADLVVMEASAFDDAMELRDLAYVREVRTLVGIRQGREEIEQGLGRSYREVRAQIRFGSSCVLGFGGIDRRLFRKKANGRL